MSHICRGGFCRRAALTWWFWVPWKPTLHGKLWPISAARFFERRHWRQGYYPLAICATDRYRAPAPAAMPRQPGKDRTMYRPRYVAPRILAGASMGGAFRYRCGREGPGGVPPDRVRGGWYGIRRQSGIAGSGLFPLP